MEKRNQPQPNKGAGLVRPREITDEMRESYIDYAMSVIVSRALPDVRDGLKPVHRRILYTMREEGLTHSAKFRKSATVVGACLGRYHPHGDQAVYDAAIRMAQDFSLRYPLIQGQGNVGSIDDPAEYAAMRYTEMRLSKIGEELLSDIDKNTVDFIDNYDGTRKEPTVLPSPLPNLLLNGALGIAVGMATNIPPHNLSELTDAISHLIDNPKATTEDLFEFIKGPDFPTGGEIFDQKEIITAYSQGKGPILVRGRAEITEKEKSGRNQIIISEIPFQVQKSALVEQFANLVSEKKIEGVKDIRDESDKEGMRIVIDLQRDAIAQKILNRLYKFSDLQKTFHLNLLALVEGIQPRVLSLPEALGYFIEHRQEVVFRRTKYELEKAKERAHILEGLFVAISNIDAVISTIKKSKDREEAKKNLMKKFKLTEIQANAILEIKLQQLARLEREKIEEELKQKKAEIKELSIILKSPQKIKDVVKKELKTIKENFGDERRTRIHVQKIGEIAEEDLIPQEETIITLTRGGYIKRINPKNYKIQKRGGKGILGMKTLQDDTVEHFFITNTHDSLLFFTDSGKVFRTPVYEIPEGNRVARGRGLLNFLEISPQEKVLSLFSLGKEDETLGIKYLVMVTRNAIIKKTGLAEFENLRKSGLIAITLKKGDLLKKAQKSTGEDEIILVTKKGQAIRFREKQIREMGRPASGVKAMRLARGDEVVGMDVIQNQKLNIKNQKPEKQYLLIITENGFGKRTDIAEYRLQGRGGTGIKAAKNTPKTGDIVAAMVLNGQEEDLIVISQKGQVIRTKISQIAKLSRATQGVRIMKMEKDDRIASATCI
jgi:DNA gyrase subunit A